jgi:hypothetical protein
MIVLLGWPSSVYLYHRMRPRPLTAGEWLPMSLCFLTAAALSLATWWYSMRAGVRALEEMDGTPG